MDSQPTISSQPNLLDFVAALDNVRAIVTVLKAISYKEHVICFITRIGLTFIVQDSQSAQSIAYMRHELFREYAFPSLDYQAGEEASPEISFSVNLQKLIECLSIFGGMSSVPYGSASSSYTTSNQHDLKSGVQTTLRMHYAKAEGTLKLILEDQGVVTVCKLRTYVADPTVELRANFNASPTTSKLIINSEWLKGAFSELDETSTSIRLLISPRPPYFRISASGLSGQTNIDYPNDTDVLEGFTSQATQTYSYNQKLFVPCLKALALSTKTSVKINLEGFLFLQFLIPVGEKANCFVDFLSCPTVDDSDQDTDED
ncbi:cell cycle checkpoint protein rad1 [Polychytrium aggregatum]|uniref:cell cycle checkpoint protein rad1 n=1 Tax=Polychytrium aggregatum TaxID=110093 RepID=UPI0022FECF94|nr:cell cycle checkpoint protein rad1 [Polychytrium aggregatum]KAI9204057.1 cell cycle checkpoint protein rad1 [Polychytrium aggregatum]